MVRWSRDLTFAAASDEHVPGTCHGIHPRSLPLSGDRCSVGRWATGCLGLNVGWGKETTQGGHAPRCRGLTARQRGWEEGAAQHGRQECGPGRFLSAGGCWLCH